MFVFSYYCQGMNFKDMCMLSWDKNIVGDRIFYSRGKTLDLFNIKIRPGFNGLIMEKQREILQQKLENGEIKNELAKTLVFRVFDHFTDRQMKNISQVTKVR